MDSSEEKRIASSWLASSGIEQPGQHDAATLYMSSLYCHCLRSHVRVRFLRQSKEAQGALPSHLGGVEPVPGKSLNLACSASNLLAASSRATARGSS